MIIRLPVTETAELLVKRGDQISFETPIFKSPKKRTITLNIAQQLGIKPEKIFKYLKKFVGEKVNQGDLVAFKKKLFGTKKILSPVTGLIKEIDHNQGVLRIEFSSSEKNVFLAPVKGEIENIERDFLEVRVSTGQSFPLKEKAITFGGEIFLFRSSIFFELKKESVDGKIIVAEKISAFEQAKLEALGVKGFVTLESLAEASELPTFRLRRIDDLRVVLQGNFLYCTTIDLFDKIYFYS
ncbi:MAG: hypothetical protein NZL96_02855 [Patescibacteria group bacterium]|nr:hypothetical protein [Patescibacteria group bacterium]